MSSTAKRQIIEALDDLPERSLATVAELVELLRAKAVAGPRVPSQEEAAEPRAPSSSPAPSKGFADAYRAWRSTVAEDDLDVGTAYFDALRDTSIGPDVKL